MIFNQDQPLLPEVFGDVKLEQYQDYGLLRYDRLLMIEYSSKIDIHDWT